VAGLRAFCPFSQMYLAGPTPPRATSAASSSSAISKYAEQGRNIVLTARLARGAGRQTAEETRKKIVAAAGASRHGGILADFGAFVDLGGVQGPGAGVRDRALPRGRPADPPPPRPGRHRQVLKVDDAKGKISSA